MLFAVSGAKKAQEKEEQAETVKKLGVHYVVNTLGDDEVANNVGNDEMRILLMTMKVSTKRLPARGSSIANHSTGEDTHACP